MFQSENNTRKQTSTKAHYKRLCIIIPVISVKPRYRNGFAKEYD